MPIKKKSYKGKKHEQMTELQIQRDLAKAGFDHSREIKRIDEVITGNVTYVQILPEKPPISRIVAKRDFSLEDVGSGEKMDIKKGDIGELLGKKKPKIGYTILINDKTLYISDRKILRRLFRPE
jgi:hypothetical protein